MPHPQERRTGRWRVSHPPRGAAIPAQCRHHHRGADAQCPPDAARGQRRATVRGGPVLGKIEEGFVESADAGRHLPLRRQGAALRGHSRERLPRHPSASDSDPTIPSYAGGKFPLSTYLAEQVRAMLADPATLGPAAATRSADWLAIQRRKSALPRTRRACWSRPFRAASATTWSPIPSRGGWRTRRSACC